MAPRRIKNLTYPVWNRVLTIWDTIFVLIPTETQYNRNYFALFYDVKVGASERNIDLEKIKAIPRFNKKEK